jgi:hypothetical protein
MTYRAKYFWSALGIPAGLLGSTVGLFHPVSLGRVLVSAH